MPTKQQVYDAADRLRERGAAVGREAVRKELPRGGSNREVAPHLRDWKRDRSYKARIETKRVPEAIQGKLVGFLDAVWEAAKTDASRDFDDRRKVLEAEARASDEAMREMAACLDATETLNARLTAKADAVRTEVERLRKRLDHIRAEEFWDRVMQEVHEILPPDGEMLPDEILARLKPSVHRGARVHKEPLDAATLRKKLKVRTFHGKYVAEGEAGGFIRKVG